MPTTPENVRRILASIKSSVPFVQDTVANVNSTLRNRVAANSEKKARKKTSAPRARTPSPARSGKRRNSSTLLKKMHENRLVQMKRNMRNRIEALENQRNALQREITKLYTNLGQLP